MVFYRFLVVGGKHAHLHVIAAIVCVVAQLELGLVVTTLRHEITPTTYITSEEFYNLHFRTRGKAQTKG